MQLIQSIPSMLPDECSFLQIQCCLKIKVMEPSRLLDREELERSKPSYDPNYQKADNLISFHTSYASAGLTCFVFLKKSYPFLTFCFCSFCALHWNAFPFTFMSQSYMANSSVTSSLKLPFVSQFGSNHFLSYSLYDIGYLYWYTYAFICVRLTFSIRAAFERRACNLSWHLCFLELLLVGQSVLRSGRI